MSTYRENQSKGIWQTVDYHHPKFVTVALLGLSALGTVAAKKRKATDYNIIR